VAGLGLVVKQKKTMSEWRLSVRKTHHGVNYGQPKALPDKARAFLWWRGKILELAPLAIPRNVADRAALCGALPRVMKRALYPRAVRDKERQRRAFEDDVFAFHANAFGSSSPVTVKRTQGQGLGVFVNAPLLSVDELMEAVQGFVCSVSGEKYTALEESVFPSLLSNGPNEHYLFFGLLALCNHACDSRLGYNLIEDRVEVMVMDEDPPPTFRKGEEVLINYFAKGAHTDGFVCLCSKCGAGTTTKKRRKRRT
jgi:hypothetical protein